MIIKIWKPYGITSIQFIKNYQKENKIEKITCAGRLDPLAQGQLLILTESHTKDMKKYLTHNKIYKFDMVLGIETESHDCLSKIVENNGVKEEINEDNILNKLDKFISQYKIQKFPLVSSFVIKHLSLKKTLWWFYMNGYKNIELPEKEIKIHDYKVISIEKEENDKLTNKFIDRIEKITDSILQKNLNIENIINQWKKKRNDKRTYIVVKIELNVSSGFYIRRFCHDFGKYINTGGIALDITRIELYN